MSRHVELFETIIDAGMEGKINVLDHGFVRLVDYMGAEGAIVEAARVSYGKGTKTVNEDIGLIRRLLRCRHTSPFEMVELKFHIKLPIFVARQWIRHRTANVNEYSARYSVLAKEFYIPDDAHIQPQSKLDKQGRDGTFSSQDKASMRKLLTEDAEKAYRHYEELLNWRGKEDGMARELARMNLPVNFYTEWYWKIDLHNLLHFLALRLDHHAQYEIRAFAEAMSGIVKAGYPNVWLAFHDYVMDSVTFSANEQFALRLRMTGISDESIRAQAKMSSTEYREFLDKVRKVGF